MNTFHATYTNASIVIWIIIYDVVVTAFTLLRSNAFTVYTSIVTNRNASCWIFISQQLVSIFTHADSIFPFTSAMSAFAFYNTDITVIGFFKTFVTRTFFRRCALAIFTSDAAKWLTIRGIFTLWVALKTDAVLRWCALLKLRIFRILFINYLLIFIWFSSFYEF